jgi:hypothetical protein
MIINISIIMAEQYNKNKDLYLKHFVDLFEKYPLQWITINSDGSAFIYPTAASALSGQKDKDSFTSFIAPFEPVQFFRLNRY